MKKKLTEAQEKLKSKIEKSKKLYEDQSIKTESLREDLKIENSKLKDLQNQWLDDQEALITSMKNSLK